MKTAQSPIEIWYTDENMRPFLKRMHIISQNEDGSLTIPVFKCNIDKPQEGSKMNKSETKQYAFYHQKMQFMLDAMNGDYVRAIESWNEQGKSFLCGKNLDITVTIL